MSPRPLAPNPPAPHIKAQRSGRLRLVVIQVLVFSLFATLFARLYYLQVVDGERYHAKAASQSVRDIVVQPQRGLIVDDQGRPLVANRTSWVVSVDRTVLGKLTEHQQDLLVERVSEVVDVPVPRIRRSLVTCGDEGSVTGVCWNGSPYQPVPVASDVSKAVALRVLEQPEDFPGVLAEQQSVRAYPRPFGVNLAHVLGYLSPITEDELDTAREDADRSVNGSSVVGRAGIEQEYDRWLRGMPGYKSVAVDSMGRVLGDDGEVASRPGDTLVTSIDAKVQSVVERQLADTIRTARATHDPVTNRNYAADSGAAVVLEARTGRVVAMASQPTYDPATWVGGISKKELARLYADEAGNPLLGRATQGQFAPGSTWKPFMTAGALTNGFSTDTRLNCSSAFRVGNRDFKNYESGAYGYIGFDKALEVSCNTFFYRVGYDFWQRYGSDVADVHAKDPLVAEAKTFGFGKETGIDLPGESSGRIADRAWKRDYFESMKDYYCGIADKPQDGKTSDFPTLRQGVLRRGLRLSGGRRRQLRDRPGRHARHPAPARAGVRRVRQRRHPLRTAHRQGGRRRRRQGGPEDPAEEDRHDRPARLRARLHRPGAPGRDPAGDDGLEDGWLPPRPGHGPLQDRLGRGLRQAVDVVGGVVLRRLRRRDDGQPGRHRLRHVGPGDPPDLGDALRHRGRDGPARPRRDPGHHPAGGAADVHPGRVDPAAAEGGLRCRRPPDRPSGSRASTGC